MFAQVRKDYESLILSGVKRVTDHSGDPLLDNEQRQTLERLIGQGLAARDGDAFVLRRAHESDVQLDEPTQQFIDALHALWLRIEGDTAAEDEVLYGDLGYWQHWGNVLNDGTDREASPLRMDLIVPEQGSFLTGQWARELDPDVIEHVFSRRLVDIRVVVPPDTYGAVVEDAIHDAAALGVDIRVSPSRLQFSIYDGEIAVILDDHSDEELELHRLTRRRTIVEPLVDLFEMRWATAIPWESFVRGGGGVLEGLAQGWTDARIADALGLSPRTVSRRVAEIMQAAGTQSRFELGMKYALQELSPQSADTQ